MDRGDGMNEHREIERLRRRVHVAQLVSLLLGSVGLLTTIFPFQGDRFGLPWLVASTLPAVVAWMIGGICLFVGACLYFTASTQWARRLLWIWEHTSPVSMRLVVEQFEDSRGTRYRARIIPAESPPKGGWLMRLWIKPPDVRSLLRKDFPAQVYFDPESGRPAIVQFEHGILWSLAGNRASVRLGSGKRPESSYPGSSDPADTETLEAS